GHRSSEETSIHDILAETNVSYDKDQHAVYEDPLPGHEHRGYRHFNTLQYNYDAHRNNNSKSSSSTTAATTAAAAAAAASAAALTNARRKKILMRQRRRRSGGTVGSVGTGAGFNQDDDDEDLDLDLELELDFEHLENNHHRVAAAKSSPESPQWHLTSVELAKMEAENLKRNSLASGGGSDGLGLMPGGDGVGRGVDEIRRNKVLQVLPKSTGSLVLERDDDEYDETRSRRVPLATAGVDTRHEPSHHLLPAAARAWR
ncbi:hypothetical protein BGZ90_005991, partial [Linnemannia elongata]